MKWFIIIESQEFWDEEEVLAKCDTIERALDYFNHRNLSYWKYYIAKVIPIKKDTQHTRCPECNSLFTHSEWCKGKAKALAQYILDKD